VISEGTKDIAAALAIWALAIVCFVALLAWLLFLLWLVGQA
jgi:hypothetical protein